MSNFLELQFYGNGNVQLFGRTVTTISMVESRDIICRGTRIVKIVIMPILDLSTRLVYMKA